MPALLKGLILLVALTYILAISYEALIHRRVDRSNGIVGPLMGGMTVGQSFVSRYEYLSGVEVLIGTYGRGASPTKAALVMHLRSSPSPGPDLATVTLPPRQAIGENPWYTFKFPPIADSQDKTFYVEVESPDGRADNVLTLYWWESNPELSTDTYPQGTAYRNSIPQGGDLAFGLKYAPSPINAWAQMGRAASANVPPVFILILLLLVAILAYITYRFQALLRHKDASMRLLTRWSLPFVLGVALLNGLLYLLLIPPWQGPDEHGHFAYAALLDRYDLNVSRVQNLQWQVGGADRNEIVVMKNALWASMVRHVWTLRLRGYPTPGSPVLPIGSADSFTEFVWEIRQPPTYYWLCAATLRAARLVGIEADPYANPEVALRLMRLVSLLLTLAVVAFAWVAGVLLGAARFPWLRVLLPLTIALLPMQAFVGTSVNNDIMAELAVSGLFVALVALLRWPFGWRGAGLAGMVVLLLLACAATKMTALVAGAALAGLGLLVWLGMQASRLAASLIARYQLRHGAGRPAALKRQRPLVVPLSMMLLLMLLFASGVWAALEPESTAAGWQIGGPSDRPAQLQSQSAHDGTHVIELKPGQVAYQWVELPLPHPPLTMTFSAWVRTPESTIGDAQAQIGVIVDQRGRLPQIGSQSLRKVEAWTTITSTVGGVWTPVHLTVPVQADDRKVLARLMAVAQPTEFDSMSLTASETLPASPEWEDDITLPLFNSSAEMGAWKLHPELRRLLPLEQADIIDMQVNPQAFDKLAIARRFAYRQFRSFWGNFGWVSLPLPETLFTLINVVIALALAGLAGRSVARIGKWTSDTWLGLVSLAALAIAIIVGFARQMAPASTDGVYTDPHGRYLFVLMIPIVWLLLVGLRDFGSWILDLGSRMVRRYSKIPGASARNAKDASAVPWAVWVWSNAVALFTLYCLISLIGPYYYG